MVRSGKNLSRLYQYLIYGAIENAETYSSSGERIKTIESNTFDKTESLMITSVGDKYKVGPIIIEGTASERKTVDASNIVLYDANEELIPTYIPIYTREEYPDESGNTVYGDEICSGMHTLYYFVDSNNEVETQLIKGQTYYIMLEANFDKEGSMANYYDTYDMSKLTLKITSSYNLSTATFLSSGNNTQPVVEIEKEKMSESDTITTVTKETEEFDLSLRKFITSINDTELTGDDSRVPSIDTTTLINGVTNRDGKTEYTATYTHPKNAITVEKDDKVVYTIRIYNEGDIDGTATEIKDYLPDGLELATNSTINNKYGWVASDDGKTITTDYLKDTIIKAFDKDLTEDTAEDGWQRAENGVSGLYYADVQIECVVTAEASSSSQSLRNIAEITKDSDDDRDSTPDNVDTDNYIPPTDNSTYQEDDDDYEDLVLSEVLEFTVKKVWDDNSDEDKIRPDGIQIQLYKTIDGTTTSMGDDYKVTLNSDNSWAYTFTNLPVSENGNKITYTVEEVEVPDGYTENISGSQTLGFIVTNTHVPLEFDLSLRKFITSINRNGSEVDFDDRTPSIDTTTLIDGRYNENGELEYTATYTHSKEALTVKTGDIITYTIRIYNEGEEDGYATEITDYIPEGLALILNYNTNYNNGWQLPSDIDNSQIISLVGEDGFYEIEDDVKGLTLDDFSNTTSLSEVQLVTGKVAITTNELDDELIKAFDKNLTSDTAEDGWQKADTGDSGLYYKDVQVTCLVVAESTYKNTITNIAEITEDSDDDRDSIPNDVNTDNYIPPTDNSTYQEDDDDYEPIVLKCFDLALRKFITGVETNGVTNDVTSRIPVLSYDEDGNITYTHPKEESPVSVANNDIVIYTLRVYNEGTIAGYAEEITDDIPDGLEYLPNNSINQEYEWVMYDADGNVTEDIDKAVTIKTDYLSSAKEESEGRDNLIDAFDSSLGITSSNPDYRDVKVAFKVVEPNTSDRVLVNSAQISEDSGDDEDSDPHKWTDGEDDQDKEYIYVKYFDLSLLKWVTKTIVTVDGKTTTTETGFEPNTGKTETTGIRDNSENEPVAKVEIDKNKLNKTTVKFVYKIRVTNEGEIAGYATEITDYIPDGLKFLAEDNKAYGWTKDGDDKVTTRALETVLLQPGEYAEIEIVFTWINGSNNLGIKTNVAEISEDYNEYGSKDIDSTPNNKTDPYESEQEDDDDFALVILSLKTGKGMSYTLLTTAVVSILAGGIYLIKKYVLR